MAFIQNWREKRLANKIAKQAQYLSQKTTNREGRYGAMEFLKEIGSPEAIYGLLQRFRLTVPELTQDEEEKQYLCQVIEAFGKQAHEPLLKFIHNYDDIVHPLRLLSKLMSDEEIISTVIDMVKDMDELFTSMKTIKLVELLRFLSQFKDERLVQIGLKFINSGDDEVAIAAIDILETQADEMTRIPLLERIADPDTTVRICYRIGDLFQSLRWSLKGFKARKQVEARLKVEFQILKKGYIKRRKKAEYV